ncbi:hypothetical protein Tco_1214012 [Tanacetum coccineum]
MDTAYQATGYGISDILGTAYRTYWIRRSKVLWYGELAENVFLMVFDQSIIYGVSIDVNTAYSSKSGNGLEFFKVFRYGVCF